MNIVSNSTPSLTPTPSGSKTDSLITTVHGVSDMLFSLNLNYTPTAGINATNTSSSLPVMPASEAVLLLLRITTVIDFWIPPFLIFIGAIANVLVILVMQGRHFRHMSTSFYMTVSAVVDTASLLTSLPSHYLYVNFPHIFDSVRHVRVICSICHPSGWISSNLGVFLTVAMTVDRSLAIQFPLKAPTLCTVRRAKIVTLCLFLFELLVDGHVAFTTRPVPKEVLAYLCAVDTTFSEAYQKFHDVYWPQIHTIFLMFSFIVIVICNVIIISHVKRSEDSKDIGEGVKSAGGSQTGKSSSKSRQLSVMLIIDSASIIACTMPLTVSMMLDHSFQGHDLFDNSPMDQAKQGLLFAISFYLIQINHCANFFLYCLSGARFREALKEVLSWKSKQKRIRAFRAWNTRNAHSSVVATDREGD